MSLSKFLKQFAKKIMLIFDPASSFVDDAKSSQIPLWIAISIVVLFFIVVALMSYVIIKLLLR